MNDLHALDVEKRLTASAILAGLIFFVGGCNMTLPNLGLATPIQVVHGVFIDDVLLMLYALLALASGAASSLLADRRVRHFATLIALLGALGIISAGVNAERGFDIGQALHLVLFAILFAVAASLGRQRGCAFVLRWYLTGLVFGGAVNLAVTFARPKGFFRMLPILYMQNGAGGVLGLSVGLGALMMLVRRTRYDAALGITTAIIGTAASALAWSKTAMTICACGLIAWSVLFARSAAGRPIRLVGIGAVIVLTAATIYVRYASRLGDLADSLVQVVTIKFSGINVSDKYSVGPRYMYFIGVADIVRDHPLVGVSYGGFYDAITRTPIYESGAAADEDSELGAQGVSNPHNSFLYYASANGVPGLLVVISVFLLFVRYLWGMCSVEGRAGIALTGSIALGYFIYANTLPTLYNTGVLYIPAAVAIVRLAELRAAGLIRPNQRVANHLAMARLEQQPS